MTEPFGNPGAPSAGIQWEDLNGELLIIDVHGLEHDVPTAFGVKDAVRGDVTVVGGDTYTDALIFPKVIIGQLKGSVGTKILSRLGQGTAKAGQKPPWLLHEATADDQKKAAAHLAGQFQPVNQPPF